MRFKTVDQRNMIPVAEYFDAIVQILMKGRKVHSCRKEIYDIDFEILGHLWPSIKGGLVFATIVSPAIIVTPGLLSSPNIIR